MATNLTAEASVASHDSGLPPFASWPNLVTGLRTVAAVVLGAAALAESSAVLLVTAYATYWVGDVLDGWLARRLDQETRVGAVLDVIGDRASCAVLAAGLIVLQPQLWPAVAVFLLQFMVVDCLASLSFLHWPLLSYNYFDRVDRKVWLLNWSRIAKFLNTVSVVAVAVAGAPLLALAVASAQLALKVWTAQRIWRLLQTTEPRSA